MDTEIQSLRYFRNMDIVHHTLHVIYSMIESKTFGHFWYAKNEIKCDLTSVIQKYVKINKHTILSRWSEWSIFNAQHFFAIISIQLELHLCGNVIQQMVITAHKMAFFMNCRGNKSDQKWWTSLWVVKPWGGIDCKSHWSLLCDDIVFRHMRRTWRTKIIENTPKWK